MTSCTARDNEADYDDEDVEMMTAMINGNMKSNTNTNKNTFIDDPFYSA